MEYKKNTHGFTLALYKLTHYTSYHAFKRSNKMLSYFLSTIFLMAFCSLFVDTKSSHVLTNMSFSMMIVYIFIYYVVQAKARTMKKDSQNVLKQIALWNFINFSWSIYDGIYKSTNTDLSIEISFQHERTYIQNIYELLFKKHKICPSPDELLNFKKYIYDLQDKTINTSKFVIYSTLTPDLVMQLKKYNILMEELPRKYVTVPSRFDYATDTHDWTKLIKFNYRNFKAYKLAVDPNEYEKNFVSEYHKVVTN